MEKTIVCAACNQSWTYDEKPGYPRKYCESCSEKKQEAWDKAMPKEIPPKAVAMTGMPISEQRVAVRERCLIRAVDFINGLPVNERGAWRLTDLGSELEIWVFR